MIAELLMRLHGWEAVWCPDASDPFRFRRSLRLKHVFVGTWTGPQNDLICTKSCETNAEAEEHLSMPASSITRAAVLSTFHYWRRRVRDRC